MLGFKQQKNLWKNTPSSLFMTSIPTTLPGILRSISALKLNKYPNATRNIQLCLSSAVAEGRCPFHLPLRVVESILKNGRQTFRKPSMLGFKQQKNLWKNTPSSLFVVWHLGFHSCIRRTKMVSFIQCNLSN